MKRFWSELLELTRVRTLLFTREPEVVFWVFVFPLVLATVLGFAFRAAEPEANRVVVRGDAAETENLVDLLRRDPLLEVTWTDDEVESWRQLRSGMVDVLIEPSTPPVLHLDPVRPESETARLRVLLALDDRQVAAHTIEPMTEKGSRYLDFLFPGLIGMNLMGTGMWSIGFSVADMRQKKLLKRMLVTPMRRSAFLASFLTSRMVFLAAELLFLLAFGVWILDVPFRSSVAGFVLASALGAVVFAGLGLLTASRAKTIEGVSGLMNFVMVPMWLGSGVFFSYERFPEALHPLLQLLPLTALIDALRRMMLDGRGLIEVAPQLAVLLGWGALSFVAALKIFRWE